MSKWPRYYGSHMTRNPLIIDKVDDQRKNIKFGFWHSQIELNACCCTLNKNMQNIHFPWSYVTWQKDNL